MNAASERYHRDENRRMRLYRVAAIVFVALMFLGLGIVGSLT